MAHDVIPYVDRRYTPADLDPPSRFFGNTLQELVRDNDVRTTKFKQPGRKSKFDSCWMHKTPPCFVCVSIILPQIPLFALTISHRVIMGLAYADIRGCPGYPVAGASFGIVRCHRSRYSSDCWFTPVCCRWLLAGGYGHRYTRRADPIAVARLALGISANVLRRSHSCVRPVPDLDGRCSLRFLATPPLASHTSECWCMMQST